MRAADPCGGGVAGPGWPAEQVEKSNDGTGLKMRILVLGATGMLGHKVFQTLRGRFPGVIATMQGSLTDSAISKIGLFQGAQVIEHFDATDWCALNTRLQEIKPDVTVNCTGVIKQRIEAQAALPSISVNALLPHKLAEICGTWGGRIIHFSTDCVFSGRKGNYREEDVSDAEDLYGRSKYLGEVATANALTLRTSVIGRELFHFTGLLEWFLAQNHNKVPGYTRVRYSGVTTNHLAEVVADLLEKQPRLSGVYQVAGQTISKHDLLCLVRDAFRLDIEIVPDAELSCDRSLNGGRFQRAAGHAGPPWPALVEQLASDPTPYAAWRA